MKIFASILVTLVALLGCSGDSSSADNDKLKADLSKGGDQNAMNPDQKKKFDEYMKNRGMSGASSAPNPSSGK